MAKRPQAKITFAQLKDALAQDLGKMHRNEVNELAKAKSLKALRTIVVFDFPSPKTDKLINKFIAQEEA